MDWKTGLIICPLLFLAGFVDAIGGGGGLVGIPAYLLAGLSPHAAIATNKLSSFCGTLLAAGRLLKGKKNSLWQWLPSILLAVICARMGALASLRLPEERFRGLLWVLIPLSAFLTLKKTLWQKTKGRDRKLLRYLLTGGIGFYDGFYGAGTGTFLILVFVLAGGRDVREANGGAKVLNLATNISALVTFLMSGTVVIKIGVAAALCNMAGGYIGAGLSLKKGEKVTRPVILAVLLGLAGKALLKRFS